MNKSNKRKNVDVINCLTKVIELNPKDAMSFFNRATLKVRVGDIEGARRDFEMSENCHHDTNYNFEDYPLL